MSTRYRKQVLAALGAIVGEVSTAKRLQMQRHVTPAHALLSRTKGFFVTLLSFITGSSSKGYQENRKYPDPSKCNKTRECARRVRNRKYEGTRRDPWDAKFQRTVFTGGKYAH